ncbi:MAG: phosphotransferase family protein [Dehalococcoidia bacterium]
MEQKIAAYLAARLAGADAVEVSNLYRIPGGQSRETWSFDAVWRESGVAVSRGFILRRDPDASLLESDRNLEFGVMKAMRPLGVPVPEMYWLEEDAAWIDRPFCMMERIDGCEASPNKVLLDPLMFAARERIAEEFTEILARIHEVSLQAPGLAFMGRPPAPEECGMREVAHWEAIVAKESIEPQPVLRAALRWLCRHQPAPAQKVVLVHGDYRTGNFLAGASGEIKAVLDWEMTHLGDPMEDVAWACIRPWRWMGNEMVGGLMDRGDFFAKYEAASGLTVNPESIRFWEVLGNLKLATIFLTGGRSYCDGRTRSAMMAFIARNVRRLELEIMDLMEV